ncbi:hypothetical protein PINS_up023171 [Pythium insidiosum]|nr:hypothetical protein PINS_up023171 [Pythium insidiosum]
MGSTSSTESSAPRPFAKKVLEGDDAAFADAELAAYLANEREFHQLRSAHVDDVLLPESLDHVTLSTSKQLELFSSSPAWIAGSALVVVALALLAWRKTPTTRAADAAPLIDDKRW